MLNKCFLQGRIVHTPELRHTNSGTAVLNIDLAVKRGRKGPNGEDLVDFPSIVFWGKIAETVGANFKKGDPIVVYGRLESRKYQDKNGNNRTAWEVQADGFEFELARNTPADSASGESAASSSADNSGFAEVADNDADVPF